MGKAIRSIVMIAAAVFAPALAASLGLTGFAATAFGFVLQTALGAVLGPAKSGAGGGGAQDSGMLVNKQGNVQAIPVVYGNRRIGGTRVYIETTNSAGVLGDGGDKDEYLHLVLAVAQGGVREGTSGDDAIKSINTIYFNDRVAWTKAGGIDSYFSNLLTVRTWYGAADQTLAAPNDSAGSFGISAHWDSSHRLRGVAYVYCILKYDRDKYPGAPNITCDITGRRIQSVNALGTWSDNITVMSNPANILYDYLTSERFGKGISPADIDLASFKSAETWANTAGVGGGQLSMNGAINTADTIFNNVQTLLSNSNINLVFIGGKYYAQPVRSETFNSQTFDFNTSNILGKWTISLGNKRTRFNRFKVNFFNPDLDWQSDSVIVERSAYLAADSGVINEKEINFPLVSNRAQAEELGYYYLDASRYQTMVSFTASFEALKLAVGDPVTITHEVPNWTGKKFRVNAITLLPDATVEVVLEEYAPDSIYLETP